MADQTFKSRVHAREVGFYDGDLYHVEMVTTQRIKNQKLTTERKISRVIGPVEAPIQKSLVVPEATGRRIRKEEE